MELKQILCFVTVAEELNFTLAAQKLFVSQPGLSRHIQNLERELGLILFERDNKSVTLTPAGLHFLSTARELLHVSGDMLYTAKCLREGMQGKLKIGYQGSARHVIPPLLRDFRKNHPDILITLEQRGAEQLLQQVQGGALDLGVAFSVIHESMPKYDDLAYHTIARDRIAVFMDGEKAQHYQSQPKVSIQELSEETYIQISTNVNPGYFEALHRLYLQNNFYPRRILQTPIMETMLLLVESGMGISLLPEKAASVYFPNVPYLYLPELSRPLHIEAIWRWQNTNPCLPIFLTEEAGLPADTLRMFPAGK